MTSRRLTVRKYSLKEDNLDAPNMLGVIAQEVEAAGMSGLVTESIDQDLNNNDLDTVTKVCKLLHPLHESSQSTTRSYG